MRYSCLFFMTTKNNTFNIKVKATGYSMYPYITPGMTLILQKTSFKEIRAGDVISLPSLTFINIKRQRAAFVTHRVFRKNHKALYTKGDSNEYVDANKIFDSAHLYRLHTIIYQSKEFICLGFKNRLLNACMHVYSFLKLFHVPDRYLRGRSWIVRKLTGFIV